ncbi:MAG: DNA mismatch repair protein MutS [Deltaproteobacteria bacterium]|nr:DNA mismatch repair protein MutS [Deltaproteobacteria bacterium]
MFRQYLLLKEQHPDALLMFRMGDFFELFFDDARRAAPLLDLVLTSRNRDDPDPIPMCGVPRVALDTYLRRLVDAGHKVAIAEQVEDPRLAKGLVDRRVIRVVSPGVVLDPEGLEAREPNWLAGILDGRDGRLGLAWLDVTTGDLRTTEVWGRDAAAVEIGRLGAREAVVPSDLPLGDVLVQALGDAFVNRVPRERFAVPAAVRLIQDVCGIADLSSQGVEEPGPAVGAAGALLAYARENSRSDLRNVHRLRVVRPSRHLHLDPATRRNLEVDRSLVGGARRGSLLGLLDRTATSMGGRLLREWLAWPLVDPADIRSRLDAVEILFQHGAGRDALRATLEEVADIERIGGKIALGSAHARDLAGLRQSLERMPDLARTLASLEALGPLLPEDLCEDIRDDLARTLVDDPPVLLTEGGLIREGFDPDLDHLALLARKGRGAIAEMEARERIASGIGSLRIRHHKALGYTLEITHANSKKVPEHYRRVQALTNCDRFVTPELQEFEDQVLTADARRKAREQEIFEALRIRVSEALVRLQVLAAALAHLDVLSTLAEVAVRQRWVRPEVHTGVDLDLEEARHPVVEAMALDEPFIPNSLRMEPDTRRLIVLTGPNMSGKSTIMRQAALVVLLAQMGAFVPARRARIGVCDRIFVRVGATDDVARGRSTFMVEMAETANILHNATQRSLVLLDEIGRGTSTYDGLAIAWAVAEALHDRVRCRTIFATHYHELVGFARRHPATVNLRVAVSEMGDRILFLRRLQEGATSRSYGIQCARIAGMPEDVVARARTLLRELEQRRPRDDRQLSLFDLEPEEGADAAPDAPENGAAQLLVDAVRALRPDTLAPREALEVLYRLRSMV